MIKICEADSDYIKLPGGVTLPTNASDYGYSDYGTVSRQAKHRYDNEQEEKRLQQLKAEADKKLKDIYKLSSDKNITLYEAMEQVLVPDSGKADTVAGELIRAMQRIMWRGYNDGDLFWLGYGKETCGPSAYFIADNTSKEISMAFDDIANSRIGLENGGYDKYLEKISNMLANYIIEHKELVATPNAKDSRDYNTYGYWYEFDIFDCELMIPDNVKYHLDNGDITEEDIENEINYWDAIYTLDYPQIDVDSDVIVIHNLPYDYCSELEEKGYNWLEYWGDSLDEEYGSEYDDDDEY